MYTINYDVKTDTVYCAGCHRPTIATKNAVICPECLSWTPADEVMEVYRATIDFQLAVERVNQEIWDGITELRESISDVLLQVEGVATVKQGTNIFSLLLSLIS